MSQEPSIEAARSRIQRLVDEIAALSKKEIPTEEFLQQFLVRVVQACDGKGGGVWLVAAANGRGKRRVSTRSRQWSSNRRFSRATSSSAAHLLKVLSEVVQTREPMVFAPDPQVQGALQAPAPGRQPDALSVHPRPAFSQGAGAGGFAGLAPALRGAGELRGVCDVSHLARDPRGAAPPVATAGKSRRRNAAAAARFEVHRATSRARSILWKSRGFPRTTGAI